MTLAVGTPKAARAGRSFGARILLALKIALGSTLALGVTVGVVLYMDLAVTRRLVAGIANKALRPVFRGRLTIESLGRLGLDGFDGARVRIDDPSGQPVLTADGVSGRIAAGRLARIILGASGPIELDITEATVEHADLRFDTDERGMPLLEHALTPVDMIETPVAASKPSRPVRVVISSANVRHAWVHGHPTWAPAVDLEGRDIEARVVVDSSGSVEVDVHKGQLLARAMPIAGSGAGSLHGRVLVPSEHGHAAGITASFEGTLGGIDETAQLSLDGDDLAATLDLKEVAPEKVRSLVPDYPVQDLLTAHVEARGAFPDLDVVARAQLRGGGLLATSGRVHLSATKTASFHATLAAIDLRGIAPGMPVSSLGAEIDATLALDEGNNLTGTAKIVSDGGTIGTQILPAGTMEGSFSSGARGPFIDGRVDATVAFRDPGVTGTVGLHLHPKGKSFELAFDAKADAPRLNGIPRIKLTTQGSAAASAHGTLALDTFALSADVQARGQDLRQGPARLLSATGTAHVGGTVFVPRIEAKVHGTSLDLSGARADSIDLTAEGLARAPRVHVALAGGNLPDVVADADVQLGATTRLEDVRATFSRAAERAELHADAVRITSDGMTAERVTIDGLGGPVHADLRLAPHVLEVRASGRAVDAGLAARLAGVGGLCNAGKLAFDVDATVRGARAEGRATVDLTDASVLRVHGASAHAELELVDRAIAGRAHAELGDLGTVDLVASKVHMGKDGASSLRSWERAWGSVELNARVDMARLEEVLPEGSLPFRVTHGQLELAGKLKRDSANDDTPHLAVSARTLGLAVEARADEAPPLAPPKAGARAAPKWKVDGVDLGVDARIDGESGFAELAGRVVDAKGPLVSVDAKSTAMPYTAILSTPSRAWELLSGVGFAATVVVPRRDVSTFPQALGLVDTDGELAAEITLRGTLAAPEVDLAASLSQAHVSLARISFPVDFELTSHYSGERTDARLVAKTTRRGQVMDAEAHLDGRLFDVVARPVAAAWAASGHAHLTGFPLGGIGYFEDRQVSGHITGDIVLEGLHKDARATLDLAMSDLQIGDVSYKDARVKGKVDGRSLDATARLDHGDGSADGHAIAAASWGAELIPSIDPPIDLSLSATAFRAETLLPFAHETLAELEGRIDGKAHVAYDPRENKTELEGKLVYSHGKFEVSSAAGEFHDVTATLVLTPDGVVRIIDASASGVTGKVQAALSARLATGKTGLMLGAARGRIDVSKKTPIPIMVEGTPLGTIAGAIEISENPTPDGKGMTVAVDIPTLHVHLPESGSRSLQSLGELSDAEVGVRRGSREIVLVPLGPPQEEKTRAASARRIEITMRLGNDVEVKRGVDLKVGLEGQPVVTVTDKVHVSGQIRLRKGGMLNVQGKSFEIEKGTITFVGDDPENPQVVVTAGWNAPDGTRIYADYIGPLKTGRVVLRSEPPLAQPDIVALLLFGSVESQSGAPGQTAANSATTTAVSAAGGVATQPINHALDQFGVHALAARVDTSQSTNPKPEVELQIAKNISVQLAVVIGTPPPGANPDSTLLTLNWRLLRGLTVATTVGNSGSSFVDMVWERRY